MSFNHGVFERNAWLLSIGPLVVVAIGGLVEIVPLFYLKSTIEKSNAARSVCWRSVCVCQMAFRNLLKL